MLVGAAKEKEEAAERIQAISALTDESCERTDERRAAAAAREAEAEAASACAW